jgi:hypothetical protein
VVVAASPTLRCRNVLNQVIASCELSVSTTATAPLLISSVKHSSFFVVAVCSPSTASEKAVLPLCKRALVSRGFYTFLHSLPLPCDSRQLPCPAAPSSSRDDQTWQLQTARSSRSAHAKWVYVPKVE